MDSMLIPLHDLDASSAERLVAQPPDPPEEPGSHTPRLTWVPIRALSDRHRDRILAHLLRLPEHDRYLRFGYAAADAQIARYVDQLDFERDELLGVFNRRLRLLAMAHLAYFTIDDGNAAGRAEFGVSIDAQVRGRGYGTRLFDLAVLHARNRGVHTLLIHALSQNAAMLRIARHAGADVVRDGSESQASLKLPPESLVSHVTEFVEAGAAALNYRFKQHARRIDTPHDPVAAMSGDERWPIS